MNHSVPPLVVDALPAPLWFAGNIYRVFGREVHLCYSGGGRRVIESDGARIARGHKRFGERPPRARDATRDLLWS